MTKVDILRLDSVTNNDTTATLTINTNFQALQEAMENTLSRDGSTPNYMDADLDMNSYKIINAGAPENDSDVITKGWFDQYVEDAAGASAAATAAAERAESSAQSAEIASAQASVIASTVGDAVQAAHDWAIKTDGPVDGNEYSSKYYAEQITPIAENIITVSGIAEDVTTVAGISEEVTAVANNEDNINAVSDNEININTVSINISDVNSVGTNIANVNSVAGSLDNIDAVVENISTITAVAEDLDNIDAASGYADEARVWATGEDAEVAEYEAGEHSSRGYADIAMAIANTPEDVPIDVGGLLALDVIRGARGEGVPEMFEQSGKWLTTDGHDGIWSDISYTVLTDKPVNVSTWTNDADYQNGTQVSTAINALPKHEVVAALPADPDQNTFYYIPVV